MTIFDPYKEANTNPTAVSTGRGSVSPTLVGTEIGRIDTGKPQASGALYAVGFLLGWAAVLVPLIMAGLVIMTPFAVDAGWQTPEPLDTGTVVLAGGIVPLVTLIVASVLAATGRRQIRAAHNAAGAVWLAISLGVLALVTVWVGNTTGIPFP